MTREELQEDVAGRALLAEGLVPDKCGQFLWNMRKNTTNYVAFMYRFAPVLLPSHIWHDTTKVQMALMNNNFGDLLTVGDEAFLLLVFDNYMSTWHEKMLIEKAKGNLVVG
jgi:hypothetical protein